MTRYFTWAKKLSASTLRLLGDRQTHTIVTFGAQAALMPFVSLAVWVLLARTAAAEVLGYYFSISAVVNLATIPLANLASGQIVRTYHEYERDGRLKELRGNLLALSVGALLIVAAVAAPLLGRLPFAAITAVWVGLRVVNQMLLQLVRARAHARRFTASTMIAEIGFAVGITLVCVIRGEVSLNELLWVRLAMLCLSVPPLFEYSFWKEGVVFDRHCLLGDLAFTLPVMLENTSAAVIAVGDRVILSFLGVPMNLIGVYGTVYSFLNNLSLIALRFFKMAIDPIFYRWWSLDNDRPIDSLVASTNVVYRRLTLLLVLAGLAILACGNAILPLALGPKLAAGAPFSGILILSFLVFNVGESTGRGLMFAKQMKTKALSFFLGAALNVLLNFLLIPLLGLWGCALATLVSYAVDAWIRWFLGRRWLPIRYTTPADVVVIILAALLALAIREVTSPFINLLLTIVVFGSAFAALSLDLLRRMHACEAAMATPRQL